MSNQSSQSVQPQSSSSPEKGRAANAAKQSSNRDDLIVFFLIVGGLLLSFVMLCAHLRWGDVWIAIVGVLAVLAVIVWTWMAVQQNQPVEIQPSSSILLWTPSGNQLRVISIGVFILAIFIVLSTLLYPIGVVLRKQTKLLETTIGPGWNVSILVPQELQHNPPENSSNQILIDYRIWTPTPTLTMTATSTAIVTATTAISTSTPVVSQTLTPTPTTSLTPTMMLALQIEPPGAIALLDPEGKPVEPMAQTLDYGWQAVVYPRVLGENDSVQILLVDQATRNTVAQPQNISVETRFAYATRRLNEQFYNGVGFGLGTILAILGVALELRKQAKDTLERDQKQRQEELQRKFADIIDICKTRPLEGLLGYSKLQNSVGNIDNNMHQSLIDNISKVKSILIKDIGEHLHPDGGNIDQDTCQLINKIIGEETKFAWNELLLKGKISKNVIASHVIKMFKLYKENARKYCSYWCDFHDIKPGDEQLDENNLQLNNDGAQDRASESIWSFYADNEIGKPELIKPIVYPRKIYDMGNIMSQAHSGELSRAISSSGFSFDDNFKNMLMVKRYIFIDPLIARYSNLDKSLESVFTNDFVWWVVVEINKFSAVYGDTASINSLLSRIFLSHLQAWIGYLSDKPGSIYALDSGIRTELARMLLSRYATPEVIYTTLINIDDSKEKISMYKHIEELCRDVLSQQKQFASRKSRDSYADWLHIRPYGTKRTFLVIFLDENEDIDMKTFEKSIYTINNLSVYAIISYQDNAQGVSNYAKTSKSFALSVLNEYAKLITEDSRSFEELFRGSQLRDKMKEKLIALGENSLTQMQSQFDTAYGKLKAGNGREYFHQDDFNE